MSDLVGIDLGTTACKVTVVHADGTVQSSTSFPYSIHVAQQGWAEQDADMWWATLRATLARAGYDGSRDYSDTTVGFTGQMHSFVMLDEDGTPLRPSILWCDQRASDESAMLDAAVPGFAAIAGNPPLPAFTLPQLLWVRDHERAVFEACRHVLVSKDYLRYRATGLAVTEWTDASGTAMLDSRTREWSSTILNAVHLSRDLLPPVLSPVSDGGTMSSLLPGAATAVGVGDQFAEAVSAGAFEPGDLTVSLGTSATLLGISNEPVEGAFCYAPEDRWLRLESLHSGAKALEWFAATFLERGHVTDAVDLARHSRPGAGGVSFLPFLLGDRRAGHASAPSAFIGMTLSTTLADLARAVLEGVAFELRRMHDVRGWTWSNAPMTMKGGGSRSPLWNEIVAAAFERPYRVGVRDAAFGAAAIAGLRSGRWSSYTELGDHLRAESAPAARADPDMARDQAPAYRRYLDRVGTLGGNTGSEIEG